MKRIVSLILTAVLLLSVSFCFTTGVGADGTPTLTVSNPPTVKAGKTFTVTVEISSNPGIWGTKILLYFDPELVCESVTAGEVFIDGDMTLADDLNRPAATNGVARAAFDSRGIAPQDFISACAFFTNDDYGVNNYNNGVLATFTMRAPSEPGTYFIGVLDSLGDVINCVNEDIVFTYSNSSIVVEPSVHVMIGDVNGDEAVDIKDVNLLKKYVSSAVDISLIVPQNSDFDGNGDIDMQDIRALKKYVAGGA